MAHWKRVTGTDGYPIDVNMDVVAYLHPFKDHTAICFVGGRSGEGKVMLVSVRETPDMNSFGHPTPFRLSHQSE